MRRGLPGHCFWDLLQKTSVAHDWRKAASDHSGLEKLEEFWKQVLGSALHDSSGELFRYRGLSNLGSRKVETEIKPL